jgi:thermostable 8-oxoguanine DNA glycosylase
VFLHIDPAVKTFACDRIISDLRDAGLIGCQDPELLQPYLKRTRFYRNKSRYLVKARRIFDRAGCIRIKEKIDPQDIRQRANGLCLNDGDRV